MVLRTNQSRRPADAVSSSPRSMHKMSMNINFNKIMQVVYILAVIVGLHECVLLWFTGYALPQEDYFAHQIIRDPECWSFTWNEIKREAPSGHVSAEFEDTAKETLIEYISKQKPWYWAQRQISVYRGLVLLAFGIIGFLRERYCFKSISNKLIEETR